MLNILKKAWKLWSDLLSCKWADQLAAKYPRWADGFYSILLCVALILFAYADLDFRGYSWHGFLYPYVTAAVRIVSGLMAAAGAIVIAYMMPKIIQGSRNKLVGPAETPHSNS